MSRKSVNIKEVGIYGFDDINDRWQSLIVDASGNLKVALDASASVDIGDVQLKNIAEAIINPATEDTLANIYTVVGQINSAQSNGTQITNLTNVADVVINPATEELQNSIIGYLSGFTGWEETGRLKVNPIVGIAGVTAGSGVVDTGTQRMVLASDVGLPAGSSLLGSIAIDQSSPGTSNKVSLSDETTKVIGTVNQGTSPWVISGTVTTDVPGTTVNIINTPVVDIPEFFEDTNFVVGDSPVTLDLNTALGRNSTQGWILNDGAGNFTLAFSTDGIAFSDEITLKEGEKISFDNISVDSIRITWVANSSYRVLAI